MGADSKQQFLDLVNQDNSLALTDKDVIFGTVLDTEDRSTTRIKAAPGSGYRGGVTLRYRRLKLGTLFGFFQPKVLVPDSTEPTPQLLLALLKDQYGVDIALDDMVVLRKTIPEGDFYVVEAKNTSMVYSDSVEVLLTFNQLEISTVIDPDSLSYVYPTVQDPELAAKIDGLVYSGGWYVPEAKIELGKFVAGNFADKNLAWLVQTLSGDDWAFEKSELRSYNLAGALVDYNDPVSGVSLIDDLVVSLLCPQEESDRNVLVLKLDETLCDNFVGLMTIYY